MAFYTLNLIIIKMGEIYLPAVVVALVDQDILVLDYTGWWEADIGQVAGCIDWEQAYIGQVVDCMDLDKHHMAAALEQEDTDQAFEDILQKEEGN